MNRQLREILNSKIKKAVADSDLATQMNHPGLTGKLRELFLHELIIPLLNSRYSTGSGKVTDYEGRLSKEMDLCVYSTRLHPPFFFSRHDRTGIYPIESVLGCFEVKSSLTLKEMKDAFEKFAFMNRELKFTPGVHDEYERPMPHLFSKPEYSIFAYDIGTKKYKITSILDMYRKVDPEWNRRPLISSICVANRGCIVYHPHKGWLHMAFDPVTMINEEVIFYLCATIQGFPSKEQSRNIPRIGYYLTNPSQTARFENGRPVERPWANAAWSITNTNVEL